MLCLLANIYLPIMAAREEHIKTLRLVDLSRNSGSEATGEEQKHLRECEECQQVLASLAHEFSGQRQLYEKGNTALYMPSGEDNSHIALETLWKFRTDQTPLSQDELNHLYRCDECLGCLATCQACETIEQAKQLQQSKHKRSGQSA